MLGSAPLSKHKIVRLLRALGGDLFKPILKPTDNEDEAMTPDDED